MMKAHVEAILRSYAEILFLQGWPLGTALFVATLVNPNAALAGILAVLAAYAFAQLLGMQREFLASGYSTYNPLLVGLSIGYLFRLNALSAFFVVTAGVLAFLLTAALAQVFSTYFRLPILSVPFVVVSSIAYLASLRYSGLLVAAPQTADLLSADLGLPAWLSGFFRSFGAILFTPYVLPGLAFSAVVLFSSRILFLLSLLGYLVGAALRTLLLGSATQAFADFTNFNFILIAMALGGVFLVPSVASYLLAVVSVAASAVLLDAIAVFWSSHGIPAFTLPFNIATLAFLYVLGLLRHPMVAVRVGRTPEETIESFATDRLRFPGHARTLYLPFSGQWTVWQGFEGPWTHKGSWACAYDFVITDQEGRTCRGEGERVEDFYAYGKPVFTPVRGRVVAAVGDLPDQPPGQTNEDLKWGNYVILHDPRGFYVAVSHLAAGSVRVKPGDWVERGAILGLCGNSGYSPQPHIHVQAQVTEDVGAASAPFSFVSYTDGARYHSNDRPPEGARVEALLPDKRLEGVTSFVLDETRSYEVLRRGTPVDRVTLTTRMAPDGALYFLTPRGRLYVGKHEGTLYLYRVEGNDPWLRLLLAALPRLPLAYRDKLSWRDHVPVGLITTGPRRALLRLAASLWPGLAVAHADLAFVDRDRVESVVTAELAGPARAVAHLDPRGGLARVEFNDLELRRIVHEKA